MVPIKLIVVLFLCFISPNFLADKDVRQSDSADYYAGKFIRLINNERNFDLNEAIAFIGEKKIQEYLLKNADNFIGQVPSNEGRCQFFMALADNYFDGGAYIEAQPLLIKALEIAEKNKLENFKAAIYNMMGNIFIETNMFDAGLKNYYKALRIHQRRNDSANIGTVHLNLGNAFYKSGTFGSGYFDSARSHLNLSIKITQILNAVGDLNRAYQAIGLILTDEQNYKEAEKNFRKSIQLCNKFNATELIHYAHYQLARVFINRNEKTDTDSAIFYLHESNKRAIEYGDAGLINEILYELARAYLNKKNYKLSSYYAFRFSEYNDSLITLENAKVTAELSEKYESVKKEAQISELNLSHKEKQAQIDRQFYMIVGSVVILIFVGFAAFSLYRSNQIRKKVNSELNEKNVFIQAQKKEVEKQKELVDEKNKEILDSIRYAKRIQHSLLPTQTYIERNLSKLRKNEEKS